MVLTNNNNQQQQTTVTTRTSEVPGAALQKPLTGTINKEATVTNVLEKPVLQNVIEKKNVEIHHKPVVQEIHQQKVIEIEKQPLVQNVQQAPLIQQTRAETKFEEIGSANLGEQERLRLQQLKAAPAPQVTQQGTVQQFHEGETVAQVIRQENIERHVQPVVTEVRNQKVVQEVVQPVVRKVYEAPIIREVTTQAPIQQQSFQGTQNFQQQAPLQSGFGAQQQGLGSNLTTTTSNTGANAFTTERANIAQHEQKILNKEGGSLSTAERSNLAQHERVVDAVTHGSGTTGTTGATSHRTGFNDPYDDDSQKPGFFDRVKEKLHLGHHHNS